MEVVLLAPSLFSLYDIRNCIDLEEALINQMIQVLVHGKIQRKRLLCKFQYR